MLNLNGKMTPHEYIVSLEKVVSEMNPEEIAQFIIYLRDEAYDNKLQLSPVTVGYLADIAYSLASPQSRREWEKSIASMLGAKGGSKTSEAKAAAARANGRKGGRPKKKKTILFEQPGIIVWVDESEGLVIIEDANERQEAPDTPENRERFISWAKELVDTWRKEQSVE